MFPENKMVEMVTVQGIRYRVEEAPKLQAEATPKPVKRGPGRPRKTEAVKDADSQ